MDYTRSGSKLYSAEQFIVTEIDLLYLPSALNKLIRSVWWNVYGLFVVQMTEINSCQLAFDYLKVLWDFNVLKVVYACFDENLKRQLYTFNPYSHDAPDEWSIVGNITQPNGHPLIFFQYSSDSLGKIVNYFCDYFSLSNMTMFLIY